MLTVRWVEICRAGAVVGRPGPGWRGQGRPPARPGTQPTAGPCSPLLFLYAPAGAAPSTRHHPGLRRWPLRLHRLPFPPPESSNRPRQRGPHIRSVLPVFSKAGVKRSACEVLRKLGTGLIESPRRWLALPVALVREYARPENVLLTRCDSQVTLITVTNDLVKDKNRLRNTSPPGNSSWRTTPKQSGMTSHS